MEPAQNIEGEAAHEIDSAYHAAVTGFQQLVKLASDPHTIASLTHDCIAHRFSKALDLPPKIVILDVVCIPAPYIPGAGGANHVSNPGYIINRFN